jgi:hypothetical protein
MSKRYPGGIIRKTPQTPSQTSAQGIWDMASVTQAVKENTWPIAGVPDPISKSLRFRSSASAYLNRTPASAGNRRTWTWSGWIKRGSLATTGQTFFDAYAGLDDRTQIQFDNNQIRFLNQVSASVISDVRTTQVFRDPSAWYHVVVAVDTTQATSSNRIKLYVNGSQITDLATATYQNQNTDTYINATNVHDFGRTGAYTNEYFDGYNTEVYFIDGQALTPSSFGNTNDQTGVWQPIAYTGTYGTNGFYLPFSNTASTTTLGYDFSGNSNNWTTNNISLTSGSTYDSMNDVPTQWIPYNTTGDVGALFRGNYCVLNPIARGTIANGTITGGNLNLATTTSDTRTYGTFGFPSSGKYYYELTNNNSGDKGQGIASADNNGDTYQVLYFGSGNKQIDGTSSAYGASYTTNDVIGVAVDIDNNQVTFYKNGASQGAISYTFSSKPTMFPYVRREASTDASYSFNFGQRPFSYTPPSGFKTLNTTNLPTPTIGVTASTTANKYFDATLYTGAGNTSTSITNAGGFQPDFVWTKARSIGYSNYLYDSVRGTGTSKSLVSNGTGAEGDDATNANLSSFNSNGWTIGTTSGTNALNASGQTFVGWQWRASNATAVTNTAGTRTSTVSVNTTAGFSIVLYSGNSTRTITVGHGLGVTPSMIIVKNRSTSTNWPVYHSSVGANKFLYLNSVDAATTSTDMWNNTAPTSTVFSVGDTTGSNGNGNDLVAYCFAQVAGYSAFGSYTGNGSTDGPFIFTGFRPRYIMIKALVEISNWFVYDTARNTYNTMYDLLFPSDAGATYSDSTYSIDVVSNGFKIRGTGQFGGLNNNGNSYIYMAFAESPFKYSLAR